MFCVMVDPYGHVRHTARRTSLRGDTEHLRGEATVRSAVVRPACVYKTV